ncbi:MAG: hypothetical protein U0802_21075 [Candidatus Binatia bacterium]
MLEDPRERQLPDVVLLALEDSESGETCVVDTADPAPAGRVRPSPDGGATTAIASCAASTSTPSPCAPTSPTATALLRFFRQREKRR